MIFDDNGLPWVNWEWSIKPQALYVARNREIQPIRYKKLKQVGLLSNTNRPRFGLEIYLYTIVDCSV